MLTPGEIQAMRLVSIRNGAREFWQLADEIASEYGFKASEFALRNRGKLEVNEARGFLCYHAIKRGVSAAQIGRWINRDHSAVLDAARKAEAKLAAVAKESGQC